MKTRNFLRLLPAVFGALALDPEAAAQTGTALGTSATTRVSYLFPTATPRPPSTPADFRIAERVADVLSLTWSPSQPAPTHTLSGYRLYRNGVAIATTTATTASVAISPAGDSLEIFSVRAVDEAGNVSPPSAEIVAPHGAEIDLREIQIETKRIFAQRKNLAIRGFTSDRRYRQGTYAYHFEGTLYNYGYDYTTILEDRSFIFNLDANLGRWSSIISGHRSVTFVDVVNDISHPPVTGVWMASASDPTAAEYWEGGELKNTMGLVDVSARNSGDSDTESIEVGSYFGDVTTVTLADELSDEEFRAGIAADYAVGENMLPTMDWNSLVSVSYGAVTQRRGRGGFYELARRLEYEEDEDTIEILGGQYRLKVPGSGVTTLRWAEVTTPFDGSDPIIVNRTETIDTGINDGYSATYTLLPPPVPGTTDIILLVAGLAVRTPAQVAASTSSRRLFQANAIFPGEAAELIITPGDSLIGRMDFAATIRYSPSGDAIRLFGIDPAIELELGLEAALVAGIEIANGADLISVPNTPGLPDLGGWKLVAVGQAPGVVEIELQMMIASDAQPSAQKITLTVFPNFGLAVDANRDGAIRLAAETNPDGTSPAAPWRFWANDDDDAGDTRGLDTSKFGSTNSTDEQVNGMRDLIDFFPMFLDLRALLTAPLPGAPFKYRLKHADSALNFVYTNLTRDRALSYHREFPDSGFGDQFSQKPGDVATHQITPQGVELSPGFLAGVRDGGWGVLLIEARRPTTEPLLLVVEDDATIVAEIRLDVRISHVEEMFRHLNLRLLAKNYNDTPAQPSDPGPESRMDDPGEALPDSTTNGKYFVFVHGYNVDAHKARGWQSEIFKRLFVMGSRARFVGVSWYGSTGLDYHKAVFHAFQAGDNLGEKLALPAGADVTVAAHSLGNMLVSHAIQSGGFSPSRYYMINAAVPLEAYDLGSVDDVQRAAMVERDWKTSKEHLFAANWHDLFNASPADHRNELTWKKRFESVMIRAHNFYSPGEDVVANTTTDSASIAGTVLRQGFNFSRGAWAAQELVKGVSWITSLADFFMIRRQAGWKRDLWYFSVPETEISKTDLVTQPFFNDFIETDLVDANPVIASAKAGEKKVQYDLLARGLPALSYAAAANKIGSLDSLGRNFDMEADGRTKNRWPTDGHTGDSKSIGRWLHSDFRDVALPYVHQMFEAMVTKGSLR